MTAFRTERDTMGEMQVPADAHYGASTARAVDNFPVANEPVPESVIHAFGYLKAACAEANLELGKLDKKLADAIIAASKEVAAGSTRPLPVDIYQTGSGTDEHERQRGDRQWRTSSGFGVGREGQGRHVHPNDHVNMGQSSNDTFPLCMCGGLVVSKQLIPALKALHAELAAKAKRDKIVKIGRTHLMDATPIRVGHVRRRGRAEYKVIRAGGLAAAGNNRSAARPSARNQHASQVCRKNCARTRANWHRVSKPNHPEAQAAKDSSSKPMVSSKQSPFRSPRSPTTSAGSAAARAAASSN
jgi:hypothetical protein